MIRINKKLDSYKRHMVGFTLVEVLITLVIIGVVAAITIPTLIENNQKTQYVTALKKVYTNFNQVLVQYSADNGCVGDLKCTELFKGNGRAVAAALAPYLNIAKQCALGMNGNPTTSGCFSKNVSDNFDGSDIRNSLYNSYSDSSLFITTDGMAFFIESRSNNCVSNRSRGVTGDMKQLCGDIWVDVNGYKGPNNTRRDIFQFYITNGKGPKLYPVGGRDDGNLLPWNFIPADLFCNGSNVTGTYCAGRIMDEGWQMNY